MNPGDLSLRTLAIAHIGAFSMPNWGDKLYPTALAALLHEIGVPAEISHFALTPGVTSAGEDIRPLASVAGTPADLVLAGGGDILRFDRRTVALDHMSVPIDKRGSRLTRLRAGLWARRAMLAGPGPWSPAAGWIHETPAALISAGVHTVPDDPAARAAVARYRAAWVRTQSGADRLAGAGIPRDRIIVAPDMIFALPEFSDMETARARGRAILEAQTGSTEPPLLFQAAQFHGWPLERVQRALESLRGLPVATFALGSYAGEDLLLARAAAHAGIPALDDLDAEDITAILAAAGAVFTTSMHAAIVAASFGTPTLVPGVGKTRDAFAVCPEPPPLIEVDPDDLRGAAAKSLGRRLNHSTEANREPVVRALGDTLAATGVL